MESIPETNIPTSRSSKSAQLFVRCCRDLVCMDCTASKTLQTCRNNVFMRRVWQAHHDITQIATSAQYQQLAVSDLHMLVAYMFLVVGCAVRATYPGHLRRRICQVSTYATCMQLLVAICYTQLHDCKCPTLRIPVNLFQNKPLTTLSVWHLLVCCCRESA